MPAADFRLYHGNALEVLAGLLAAELAAPAPGAGLLAPDTILIPQPAMKRWLQKTLAERHGIAANLRFLPPGEFVRELLAANLEAPVSAALAEQPLRWRLLAALGDPALRRQPALRPLREFLDGDGATLRAWTLAGELAAAFEHYQAWRRDWLTAWDAGAGDDDWQAELWRRARGEARHRAQALGEYLARFGGDDSPAPQGAPPRLFVFACLNVSPDVLRVIASAAKAGPLHFYLPSPTRKYWGDLRTARERLRDGGDGIDGDDDEQPLLAANGRAGRDFLAALFGYELVQPTGEFDAYASPGQPEARLLARLQRDLLERQPPRAQPGDPVAPDPADRSLQVHACHTRLREVQVLHDQLRALLEADPTLEPREIAVMAPDIDAYAPHIRAVFGGAAGTPRFIPYALADGGALADAPLADLFLRLLAAPVSRLTSNEVIEMLAVPAVSERFGLDPASLDTLSDWIAAAGARWGLTEAHRERLGAPRDASCTWSFALDRLLLGLASGDDGDLAGVAPWPQLEGSATQALDALVRLLRVLARLEEQGRRPQPAPRWVELLERTLADLLPDTPSAPEDQRIVARLRTELAAFGAHTEAAELTAPIAPEIVRAHFAERLTEADPRQPFLTGGVTVCRMVPMRLIPFRVIALLGMNEGEFPRPDPAGAIDRIQASLGDARQRRVGDRSRRDDDRFLFLQLLATASDSLYLSYLGRDPRDGRGRMPSALVAELLDVASGYFDDPAAARKALVIDHPLQPFSARGDADPRAPAYDPAWRAAQAMAGGGARLPVFADATASAAATPPSATLEFDALLRFWSHPPRAWLQHLGISLRDDDARLPDTEPFDLSAPRARHRLRQRVLAALRARPSAHELERLRTRLVAEAELPAGAAGEIAWRTLLADVRPYANVVAALQPAPPVEFSLPLGEVVLRGRIDEVTDRGVLRVRIGKLGGRQQLAHGLTALVLAALDAPQPLLEVADFGEGELGPIPRPRPTAARARAALGELVALRAQGLAAPLPFRPDTAWTYVEHWRDEPLPERAWDAAARVWRGYADFADWDAWTQLALRGADPFADDPTPAALAQADRLRALAVQVFDAVAPANPEASHD